MSIEIPVLFQASLGVNSSFGKLLLHKELSLQSRNIVKTTID